MAMPWVIKHCLSRVNPAESLRNPYVKQEKMNLDRAVVEFLTVGQADSGTSARCYGSSLIAEIRQQLVR